MALRKAFTLIELLVVIAIIAILAAILFPVFAQAKLAAKKVSSLSNNKQIVLSGLMYSNDADDCVTVLYNGDYANLAAPSGNLRTDSWVWLQQPYIKSLALMVDPMTTDSSNIFGSGPFAWWRNQDLFPYYGLNYIFLSPWDGNCQFAVGGKPTSGAAKPAQTVYFTESRHPTYSLGIGYLTASAPGMEPVIDPSPNYCDFTGDNWAKLDAATAPNPYSGDVAMRDGSGTNVGWLDGHSKYVKADALAAGTNYATSTDPTTTKVIDKTKYLWSYDDTFAFSG